MSSQDADAFGEEDFRASAKNDELRGKLLLEENKDKNNFSDTNSDKSKKNVSISQIQKFINKLKNANTTDFEKTNFNSIQEEIQQLNLNKYLSEILNCLLNLTQQVNKYSDIFLLINVIRCINNNYSNVEQITENLIFMKFFKLDENDKNYFFIIFYDMYNHINENNFPKLNSNGNKEEWNKHGDREKADKGGEIESLKEKDDFFLNNAGNEEGGGDSNSGDSSKMVNNKTNTKNGSSKVIYGKNLEIDFNNIEDEYTFLENFKKLKELQRQMTIKMDFYIGKDGENANSNFLEYDLFAEESFVKVKKKNLVDKKKYMIEMLTDNALIKKVEKKNKMRRILLCLYFELFLLNICKDKNLLMYMFLNITYLFTLQLDLLVANKSGILENEKKNYETDGSKAALIREIQKIQIVNCVNTYDFFFINTGTIVFKRTDKRNKAMEKEENENNVDEGILLLREEKKRLKDVVRSLKNVFKVFYQFSMYKLLVFLYVEHLTYEYNSSSKKCVIGEEYDFFKIYNKSKNFCKLFHFESCSLEDIQIKGIDLLGLNEESIMHIKSFDSIKNKCIDKHDRDNEMFVVDMTKIWETEEEKLFYTKFPDYSNINICVNDEDEDDDDDEVNLNDSNECIYMIPKKTHDATSNVGKELGKKDNTEEAWKQEDLEITKREDTKEMKKKDKAIEKKGEIKDSKKNIKINYNKNDMKKIKREKQKELQNYLNGLLKMNSEKELEDAVMCFLQNYNTKKKRKLIINSLFQMNRNNLNLIPYYCKYIAIINKYLKDIYVSIVEELKKFTEKMIKEKLPENINKKMKCVRFLCELAKFHLLDLVYILEFINLLIENFTSDNAELCYYVFDNCALLLLSNSKTHIRFLNILKRFKKIKSSKNLTSQMEMLFDECYSKINNFITQHTIQGGNTANKKKPSKYTEEELKKKYFLKKLLFTDILTTDADIICKYIRKFNWDDKFIEHFLKKYVFQYLMYMNIFQINYLASFLFHLAKYKPFFVTQVIDELYERILSVLEKNEYEKFTYLIQYVHLFSELYNYKILSSDHVFDLLYFLISLADLDICNSHNICSLYKTFKENTSFYENEKKRLNTKQIKTVLDKENEINRNSKDISKNGINELIREKENSEKEIVNIIDDTTVVEEPKVTNDIKENALTSETSTEEFFFCRDEWTDKCKKYLFINKRNPILYNILNSGDNSRYINIKLICIIIENCAKFFRKQTLNFKLKKFFLFFKRFLLLLEYLPIHIYDIAEKIIRENFEELIMLKTIKNVDKYLMNILNIEYKLYLNKKTISNTYAVTECDLEAPLQELKNAYTNYMQVIIKKKKAKIEKAKMYIASHGEFDRSLLPEEKVYIDVSETDPTYTKKKHREKGVNFNNNDTLNYICSEEDNVGEDGDEERGGAERSSVNDAEKNCLEERTFKSVLMEAEAEELDKEINAIINASLKEKKSSLVNDIENFRFVNANKGENNNDNNEGKKKVNVEKGKVRILLKKKDSKNDIKSTNVSKDTLPILKKNAKVKKNSEQKAAVTQKVKTEEEVKDDEYIKSFVLNRAENIMQEDRKKEELKLKKMFYKNSLKYSGYDEDLNDYYS